jgi:hypothetical protein
MIELPLIVPRAALERFRKERGDRRADELLAAGLVKIREEEGLHG